MAYRITNTSSYEGYATLGATWQKFSPGQVITSPYEPRNFTVGITFLKVADDAGSLGAGTAVGVALVDAVPAAKVAYTSASQGIRGVGNNTVALEHRKSGTTRRHLASQSTASSAAPSLTPSQTRSPRRRFSRGSVVTGVASTPIPATVPAYSAPAPVSSAPSSTTDGGVTLD